MRRSCSPLSELIGLAMFPFLGIVVILWALGTQAAIAPYATYEQVFQYSNGAISTNQTAQFVLSDAESGGLLQVGEHTLQIQSLPPKLRYRSREVARIPKSVTLHTEEVYLTMGDGQSGVVQTARTVASGSRRLLADPAFGDLHNSPNLLDAIPTQVEYDQYKFITQSGTCAMETLETFGYAAYGFFTDWEIDGVRTIDHLRNIEIELRSDSRPAISRSVYMEKITVEVSYQRATRDQEWFQEYARNVLNAVWIKRSLTIRENDALRAVECYAFPGQCFTMGNNYEYGGALYSFDATCNEYFRSSTTAVLNYERSSPYNLAGGLASPLSAYFSDQLQALNSSFAAQILLSDANSGWAGSVGLALKAINESLFAQNGLNSKVQDLLTQQVGINQRVVDNGVSIKSAVDLIYSTSKNTTSQLISALQAESDRVDALSSGTNNATNFKFALLIEALKNTSLANEAKFLQLYRGIQDVSGLLQSTSAQLTSFVQQKQFNRLLTRQFYRSSDLFLTAESEEIALVSGGIRPTVLSGLQLKALVDTIIVTSGTGAVHAVRLDFFADSYIMLNASRPWTTIEQLAMWIGVAPCVIRANSNAASAYNATTSYCTLWVEVTELDCASGYNPSSNTCTGVNTTTSLTLATSTAMFVFFSDLCVQSTSFTVSSVSLSTAVVVNPTSLTCNSAFQEKMIATDRSKDPMIVALTLVWTAFMQTFQATLQSLELIAYGQLPNGVHTEPTSMGYSPSPISGVDGGGASLQGMRAYWLSVHRETLPVTSLTYVSESSRSEEVTVSLSSSPACATSGNTTSACYSVKNSDLRTNWVFRDPTGIALPSQMVVVGDITSPSFSAIYDVPLSLIETTSNTLVRENLLTYLMMQPGTETTKGFEYFEYVSNGLFNARAGSASADDYRFPAVFDNDGYPVCNIDGGIPISSTYVAPVHNCVVPYVTSVPFFTGSYSLFGAPPVTPYGGVCSIAPLSPSQLNSVVLLYSQQVRVPDANGTLSLPPGASLSVSWTTQVEWSFSLWVNVLQSPAGQIGVTIWKGTLTVDGTLHVLELRWGSCGTTQSDSGVLYMCVDAPTGFFVKVTTTDFGTCLPGNCRYPDTILNSWSFLTITVSATKAYGYIDGLLTYFSTQTAQGRFGSLMQTGSLVSLPVTTSSDVFLVRSLKFYSWALSASDIDTEMRCGQLTVVPRCWIPATPPIGANLSWVPTSDIQVADAAKPVLLLHELRPSCLGRSSGVLISVSREQDVAHPIVYSPPFSWSSLLSVGAFTISFWMRRLVDLGSLVYSDGQHVFVTTQLGGFTPGPPQQTLTLTLKRGTGSCVEFSWVSSFPSATFGVGVYSSLLAEQTAHHYTLAVSETSAGFYLDGILQGFVANSTCSVEAQNVIDLAPGCDNLGSSLSGYADMACTSAQLVRVYSGVLSAHQIQEATACERSSYSVGNTTASYEFPLAVCTLSSPTAGVGYCRHKMMCQGHCAAYSVVAAGRFTPLQVVCDSGWLPPTCDTKCARLDEFGECITQTQTLISSVDLVKDAFSPNGYWCLALKYFQLGAVSLNGQSFVDFSYRQYEYLADLTIPSGNIVTVVPAGHCPAVALQKNGDASVWVILTNVYEDYTQIIIRVKSVGACSAPSVCCDDSYPLVIPPFSAHNWNLPSLCSSLQIEILLDFGNDQSLCQSLNTTTVASQLAASASAPVVANVARSIVITGNEVLNSVAGTNQQIVEFQVALVRAAYDAAMRGLNVRDALDDALAKISQAPPPTLPTAPTLSNPFDDPRFADILTNLTKSINDTAKAVGNQANDLPTLVTLGARINDLTVGVNAAVAQQQEKLDIFQRQTNLTNDVLRASVVQMRASLDAFNAAIAGEVQYQIAASGSGNLSTVALVFLSMGSIMGALAACWVAWPYAKDIYYSYSDWFSDRFGSRRRRVNDMQSDEEGSGFSDEASASPDSSYPSPEPQPQSNVTARAISREAHRMAQPHLYS